MTSRRGQAARIGSAELDVDWIEARTVRDELYRREAQRVVERVTQTAGISPRFPCARDSPSFLRLSELFVGLLVSSSSGPSWLPSQGPDVT
jgi:hypothetical protein